MDRACSLLNRELLRKVDNMHAGKIESSKLQIAQAMDILKNAIETIREAQEYNPDEENNGCCSKDKDAENG